MAVKIRLARAGSKKNPYYRIVAASSTSPRDGKFLQVLGSYNPLLSKDSKERVKMDESKINYWLSVGAQPTERIISFFKKFNIKYS